MQQRETAEQTIAQSRPTPNAVWGREEERLLAALDQGRSAFVLAGPALGADGLLRSIGTELRRTEAALVVVAPPRPFESLQRRVRELHLALRRAAAGRASDDALLAELSEALLRLPQPAADDSLAAHFDGFEEALAILDAEGVRVVVTIDELAQWLGETGPHASTRAAGETATWLRHLGATYRFALLAADGPEDERSGARETLMSGGVRVWLTALTGPGVERLLLRDYPGLSGDDAAFLYTEFGGHPRLVRAFADVLVSWQSQRPLDAETRRALLPLCDPLVRDTVETALSALKTRGLDWAADQFRALAPSGNVARAAALLHVVLPYGLCAADGRVAERVRVLLRGERVRPVPAPEGPALPAVELLPSSDDDPLSDPLMALGRKERLLFQYLRTRAGQRVPWQDLAAAYFSQEPEAAEDDEKALRAVRAAINRINAKLAPAADQAGSKLIRYRRSEGFYVHPESLRRHDR